MAVLEGKAIAIICRGSEADRALAIALAEAGADLALGTVNGTREEEFATASIANEVWAIGREQFNRVLDAADPAAVTAFAEEVADRLGRCDAVVMALASIPMDLDELGREEWQSMVAGSLTPAVFACQAFGKVLERGGGGSVLIILEPQSPGPLAAMIDGGLAGFAGSLAESWQDRGLRCAAAGRDQAVEVLARSFN